MPKTDANRKRAIRQRYRKCPIDSPLFVDTEIASISDFFGVFSWTLDADKQFWFRGHPQVGHTLAPSALRYPDLDSRNRALCLMPEMRRFLDMKLGRPPAPDDELGWMQVAQHYGLPTRLLDWTQNAAVALFFTCSKDIDHNGLVVILNPIELNQAVDPKEPRIFNAQRDAHVIKPYFKLDGRKRTNGKRTIAINPTWNTERIAMQQGAFTLHGARQFELDRKQASSLMCVPILKEHKVALLNELQRVGIGEMFIFPEPEHVCSHLRRVANL